MYRNVNLQTLLFTQDSIRNTFQYNGERIDDTVEKIRSGRLSPKSFTLMDVVEREGRLWCLDNRRLWVFKKAGVQNLEVKIHSSTTNPRFLALMEEASRKSLKASLLSPWYCSDYFPPIVARVSPTNDPSIKPLASSVPPVVAEAPKPELEKEEATELLVNTKNDEKSDANLPNISVVAEAPKPELEKEEATKLFVNPKNDEKSVAILPNISVVAEAPKPELEKEGGDKTFVNPKNDETSDAILPNISVVAEAPKPEFEKEEATKLFVNPKNDEKSDAILPNISVVAEAPKPELEKEEVTELLVDPKNDEISNAISPNMSGLTL